jgi:hypothetical protein
LKGDLAAEKETVAAQEQALRTKYHATKILQTETQSKCGLCQQFYEKIGHVISACPTVVKEQRRKRRESVCGFNYTSTYARKYG